MTAFDQFAGLTRSISPIGQPVSQPVPEARNDAETRAANQRSRQEAIRQGDDRFLQRIQRANENIFTAIFGLGGQVQQQNFPVSNVRSTQTSPVRQRQSPARPRRQTQARTQTRAARDPPLIVLDESDVEMGPVERRSERRTEQNQARRSLRNRHTEVIDLTDDDNVIDLTGDD